MTRRPLYVAAMATVGAAAGTGITVWLAGRPNWLAAAFVGACWGLAAIGFTSPRRQP